MTAHHSVTARRKIRYALPVLSAICFLISVVMLVAGEPWLLPITAAMYFLILAIALERTGL